ncbi:DUF4127 family protein [Paenibacillus sp. J2TS4]|uniref:DUF4127 family protein n=1 Tax=Paenibacillus sp. J2TS4 TaxID=2807194 RepID=UPI001AFE7360|nr:DUF4127 family protein [Paenibacillus sp. J2TS4]GIP32228.1 hypothetical protein J2TS4_14380 [Paenibacillus sp. J2TS4]
MRHRIALVPLDSRPCCQWFPRKIAEIAGVDLHTPPIEMLGMFMKSGNCENIRDWLLETAGSVDGLVVAADQLAFGGLIASRTNERTLEQAQETLKALRAVKERHPSKPLFVSSVLMRITITGKNAEFVRYKHLVQQYSELSDRHLRLKEAGLEQELLRVKAQIPNEILLDYFQARERNMDVHKLLIDWTAEGILDYLSITQEDASPAGVHIKEQWELQRHIYDRHVQAKTMIYPGADEGTQTLLARMLQTLNRRKVRIYPRFTSEMGKRVIPEYEDRPLEETVKAHLLSAGAVVVDSLLEADLILAVNSPLNDISNRGKETENVQALFNPRHLIADLAENVRYHLEQGRRVAIADVALPNASDMELIRYLLDERLFTRLSGYAGWNTAGNSLGTCISHAIARTMYEMLSTKGEYDSEPAVSEVKKTDTGVNPDKPEKAHYSFLLSRLMDEWGYQAQIRGATNKWIEAHLSVSPWDLETEYKQVNAWIVQRLKELFEATKPLICDEDRGEGELPSIVQDAELAFVQLPWNRTFELDVRVDVELVD